MRVDDPRRAIEATAEFQSGDEFHVARIAHCAGISQSAAQMVIDQMVVEGILAKVVPIRKPGNGRSTITYFRISKASQLLKARWDESLKWQEGRA